MTNKIKLKKKSVVKLAVTQLISIRLGRKVTHNGPSFLTLNTDDEYIRHEKNSHHKYNDHRTWWQDAEICAARRESREEV